MNKGYRYLSDIILFISPIIYSLLIYFAFILSLSSVFPYTQVKQRLVLLVTCDSNFVRITSRG